MLSLPLPSTHVAATVVKNPTDRPWSSTSATSQFVLLGGMWRIAAALWFAGIALWALITYSVLTVLTVKASKPPLAQGINGGWLLQLPGAAVGARAAVLDQHGRSRDIHPGRRAAGARGARVAIADEHSAVPQGACAAVLVDRHLVDPDAVHPRHMAARVPGLPAHVTTPLYWGAVFPLGMYTVCTLRLSHALDVPLLATIAQNFVFIALLAWTIVAAGWLASLRRAPY